jgi:hypothetical protein
MANPVLENGLGSPQSIFASSTTQFHPTGTRGTIGDRVYLYARNTSTAIGLGLIAQQAVPVTNHTVQTGALTGVAAGSKSLTAVLGATASHANQYADGFLRIQTATTTGAGQMLKLRPHAAFASAATAAFDLYDPIVTTIAGTVTWSLQGNPGADIVVMPLTTPTAPAAGITVIDVPVGTTTAPVFTWLQTWGPGNVLKQTTAATLIAGAGVIIGDLAGTCTVEATGTLTERIGIAQTGLVTVTAFASVYLKIAP